jgi:signal transduction histidine kinase
MVSLASSSENIVKLSQNMCEIIAKSMPEPKLGLAQTSLVNIINDVCNQNLSYAKTKKVKLLNKASRDLPDVMVDAEKIQEALDNYVNNAIKYALPDTVVEVRSFVKQSDKKKIIVEVSDNGVGLSEEDMAKCFQKGVILSSQPTGFEQSSGLGLWIVKRIVEDHHGKVWVDSKLGAGSTFGFELPLQ